jgi:hypothetical protein
MKTTQVDARCIVLSILQILKAKTRQEQAHATEQQIQSVGFLFDPQSKIELQFQNRKPILQNATIQKVIEDLLNAGSLKKTPFGQLVIESIPEPTTVLCDKDKQILTKLLELQQDGLAQLAYALLCQIQPGDRIEELSPSCWPNVTEMQKNLQALEDHLKWEISHQKPETIQRDYNRALFLVDHLDRHQMHPTETRWVGMIEAVQKTHFLGDKAPALEEHQQTMLELLQYPNPEGLHHKETRIRDMARLILLGQTQPEKLSEKLPTQEELTEQVKPLLPTLHRRILCHSAVFANNSTGTWEHKGSHHKGMFSENRITVHDRSGKQILDLLHEPEAIQTQSFLGLELLGFLQALRII